MQITCPHCQFSKDVNQQWIPRNPSQVQCPECEGIFYFTHDGGVQLDRPAPPAPRRTCPSCGLEQPEGRTCVNCGLAFDDGQRSAPEPEADPAQDTGEFSFETGAQDGAEADFAPSAEQLPKAGFWIRFVALFLDGIIFSVLLAGLSMLVMTLTGGSLMQMMTISASGQAGDAQVQAMAAQMSTTVLALNALYLLLALLYFVVPTGRSGQTLGKKICGIRVIRAAGDNNSVGFGRALLREIIGKWLSGLIFCLGYLMAAFHRQKQALHDLVAGTYVIKAR